MDLLPQLAPRCPVRCLGLSPYPTPLWATSALRAPCSGLPDAAAGLKGAHVREGWGATQGDGVPEAVLPISSLIAQRAQIAECVSPL